MAEIVRFPCGDLTVHGTLHLPGEQAARRRRLGVVFVASGVRSRRGPNRMYLRFARRLVEAGYPVLRYDPPGIGDSPGSLDTLLAYKKQFLDCKDSVIRAIDFFQETVGVERVALVGLCGGAYSALMASAAEPRAELLVLASLPIQDVGDLSQEAALDAAIESYFCKIFDWRAWWKFASGKSHYDWVFRAALRVLTGRYRCPERNPSLWEAFQRYIADGRKMLLAYGTEDPLYPPFAKHYRKQLEGLDGFHACCRVHVVEGATHTFNQIRWQEELIATSLAWLDGDPRRGGQERERAEARNASGSGPQGEVAVTPH